MIEQLLKPEVQKFIKDHLSDDPIQISLRHREIAGIPIKIIIDQLVARKKVAKKFPEWNENMQLIFPGPVAVEQSSSSLTAEYKASLFKGDLAIDLTGGLGVDSLALAKTFKKVIYIEADKIKAEVARHNFSVLNIRNIEVVHSTAEYYVNNNLFSADLIYIDPDRRPGAKRVLTLERSIPDVIDLKELLLSKTANLLIKASPMLDITATIKELDFVNSIHVVAVNNECKELLFNLNKEGNEQIKIMAADYSQESWSQDVDNFPATSKAKIDMPQKYLFEPNAAIMKAGLQDSVAVKMSLSKLHISTQLYTSENPVSDFPGRSFKIIDVIPVNKKAIKHILPNLKGNLSTRNFPDHVDKLKKKLAIKDGGNYYLFACRLADLSYKIIVSEKI